MNKLSFALRNRDADLSAMKACWIWFWYSDVTRFALPMLGLHLIPTFFLIYALGLAQTIGVEFVRFILIGQYLAVFLWAMCDNDYENLNRVGLSAYREPLSKTLKSEIKQ